MKYDDFLEAAIKKAEDGQGEGAWNLFKRALEISGRQRGYVLFEMGRFQFSCGDYEQAMALFLEAYKNEYDRQQIREIIFEAYYYPNEEAIRANYEKNISILSNYPYIAKADFRAFDQLDCIFIPVAENQMVIFNKRQNTFFLYYEKDICTVSVSNRKPKEIVLLINEFKNVNIQKVIDVTNNPNRFLSQRDALYLYYENKKEFEIFLQVLDLAKIIEDNRVVFLFGETELLKWFDNLKYQLPGIVIGDQKKAQSLIERVNSIFEERKCFFEKDQQKISGYYESLGKAGVLNRIRNGCPRIYIPTSRFTTALQYHARDCRIVLEEMGCEVLLDIEDNDIQQGNAFSRIRALTKFLPDIIFSIDHFREEIDPKELVFVTWIQDPLPWIMNYDTPKRILEMDVILNAFFTSAEFKQYGYPEEKIIQGPIGVNDKIYFRRECTPEFREKYGADIIAFSNAGDPEKGFENFLRLMSKQNHTFLQTKKEFYELYLKVYDDIYNGINYYSNEQYADLISKVIIKNNWKINDILFEEIVDCFRQEVGFRILKSVPLEWLAEEGYNLKIYGDEWINNKKLKHFAMGRAENGEMLSKIISCSKMIIGSNQNISTHPRVGETFLSGSLYIGPEIPKEYDYADIGMFLEKNKEILLFKNKEDLLYLINHYLKCEEERLEIVKNASIKIKNHLTHKALMNNMLMKIPKILET